MTPVVNTLLCISVAEETRKTKLAIVTIPLSQFLNFTERIAILPSLPN